MSNRRVIEVGTVRRPFSILALAIFTILVFDRAAVSDECPPAPVELVEATVSAEGEAAVVGMDLCGRFVVGWQQAQVNPNNLVDVLVRQYDHTGTPLTVAQFVSANDPSPSGPVLHTRPTIAVALDGRVRIGWLAECDDCHPTVGPLVVVDTFPLGAPPLGLGVPAGPPWPATHYEPSVGISDNSGGAVAWAGTDTGPEGLVFGPNATSPAQIRSCSPHCYADKWLPAVSVCESTGIMDGYLAICWAEAESSEQLPFFNIALQVYSRFGVLLAERAGPDINDPAMWVNDPSLEDPDPLIDTEQGSPAVAFNDQIIVVVWIGPRLDGCGGTYHIYARRFKLEVVPGEGLVLRDPDPQLGEGRAGVFTVDTDPNPLLLIDPDTARPTVALSPSTETPERFVVVWNATLIGPGPAHTQIRAQYFEQGGHARGREFTVNQEAQPGYDAILSKSGAHAADYGPDNQVVVAWTRDDGVASPSVRFTLLPTGHVYSTVTPCDFCEQSPELCLPCLRGDIDDDCLVDGLDIQPFVDLILNEAACADSALFCRADMNVDHAVDIMDIPCFVEKLLTGEPDCYGNLAAGAPSPPSGGSPSGSAPVAAAEAISAPTSAPTPDFGLTPAELDAWMAFFDWCDEQNWATETSEEQMLREMADKLRQLGIEVEGMEQYESPAE